MRNVAVSELQDHLLENLRRAESGEIIQVTHRARPIAKVVPPDMEDDADDITPADLPFASVHAIKIPPRLVYRMTSLEALRKERGSR